MEAVHRIGVFDAHCHPTDVMSSTDRIAEMKAKVLTVMSTRSQDQELVAGIAERYRLSSVDQLDQPGKQRFVVPAFGWHPWFSHQMYFDINDDEESDVERAVDAAEHYKSVLTPVPEDEQFPQSLQSPMSFSKFLKETEERLKRFPLALVGEIGLDRGFRVPEQPSSINSGNNRKHTPGTREGRPLTPFRVNMEHQKKILKAQLELAAKLTRPVSVHSVQAHGLVFEVMQSLWKGHLRPSKRESKKQRNAKTTSIDSKNESGNAKIEVSAPYPPRICMHSYSGPKDLLMLFLDPKVPAEVFFSFSECMNFGSSSSNKAVEVIEAVPEDRLLIESDLDCAGEVMDQRLEDVLQKVCDIKGWKLEQGATILRRNWERFIFGS